MNVHPVADIFPPMSRAEYLALLVDIAIHGQLVPITTWQGLIVDGRHRARACEELGLTVKAQVFEGTEADLAAFVASLNIQRRRLSQSQRAMMAAGLANIKHGGDRRSDKAATLPLVKQREAATMLNVSERLLRDAKAIERGPAELADQVRSGEKSVTQAMREIRSWKRGRSIAGEELTT